MATRSLTCPACGLICPSDTLACDCGRDFATGETHHTPEGTARERSTGEQILRGAGFFLAARLRID